MKTVIQPLGQRILVEPAEAEVKTASGLFIPDTAQKKQQRGTVVAVSKELTDDEKNQIKEAQTVLYAKYRGDEIEYNGKTFVMLDIADVLAILS
jgi:chaperonin GroES